MDYKIVNVEEKTLVSLKPMKVLNSDPEISNKIEAIWKSFLEKSSQIEAKATGKPIFTYSDYESNEKGFYNASVGFETPKDAKIPEGWISKTIPAGQYAKFIINGNMSESAYKFWSNLWKMDLNRKFDCDFEECENMDMQRGEVHIFIGLK